MIRCTFPVLVAALVMSGGIGAQDLPLPTQLLEAKTARLVNTAPQTGCSIGS